MYGVKIKTWLFLKISDHLFIGTCPSILPALTLRLTLRNDLTHRSSLPATYIICLNFLYLKYKPSILIFQLLLLIPQLSLYVLQILFGSIIWQSVRKHPLWWAEKDVF